jgi:hypothetical protein
VFDGTDLSSNRWNYAIRVNYTSPAFGNQGLPTVLCSLPGCDFAYTIPRTTKTHLMNEGLPRSDSGFYGYMYSGFTSLQKTVDSFILSTGSQSVGGGPVALDVSLAVMPEAAYHADNFQQVISSVLGLFFLLMYLYPVARITRGLVQEKELRLRELCLMMGTSKVFNTNVGTFF